MHWIFSPKTLPARRQVRIDPSDEASFNSLFQRWLNHPPVESVGRFATRGFNLVVGKVTIRGQAVTLTFYKNGEQALTSLQVTGPGADLPEVIRSVLSVEAARELGLDFGVTQAAETLNAYQRTSSRGQSSGLYGNEDSTGRQGEEFFNAWVRTACPEVEVVWLNAIQEAGMPYDFRMNGTVLVDVKATQSRLTTVHLSDAEQRLLRQAKLYVAGVRLAHQAVDFYEWNGSTLRLIELERFRKTVLAEHNTAHKG